MLGARRADRAGGVRARADGRASERAEQRDRDGVIRAADRDGVAPGGDVAGQVLRCAQHEGQRAGPEAVGEGLGARRPVGDDTARRVRVGDVHDERVDARPVLEAVDGADGVGVARVGAHAVDRLCRERTAPLAGDGPRG